MILIPKELAGPVEAEKSGIVIPEELSSEQLTGMTRSQYEEHWRKQQAKGIGQRAWDITKNIPSGLTSMVKELWAKGTSDDSIINGLFNPFDDQDSGETAGAVVVGLEAGSRRFYRDIKTAKGWLSDRWNELSPDELLERDYKRYVQNEQFNNLVVPAMGKAIAGGKFAGDVEVLSELASPDVFIPGLGIASKGIQKGIATGMRKTLKGAGKAVEATAKTGGALAKGVEKVAGFPRQLLNKFPHGQEAWRLGLVGSGVATPFSGFGLIQPGVRATEALGRLASKVGREVGEISRVFSQPSGHERFLFRLSIDPKVSKKTRTLASRAHRLHGDKFYDVLFDGLVAGVEVGALNGAIAFASGAFDEEIGQSIGGGMSLGAPFGAISGPRGSGKTLDSLDENGQLTQRSEESIKKHLAKRNSEDADRVMRKLRKVSPSSAVLLATLDQASETAGVSISILSNDQMKGSPSYYNKDTRKMVLNEDQLKQGLKDASHVIAHEIGHDHIMQMLGSDPVTKRALLDDLVDEKNGKEFYFYDSNGKKIAGSGVMLNREAQNFAQQYADRIRESNPEYADRILKDAGLLAEEMGAEAFALMFSNDPNVFAQFRPQFRQYLLGGMEKALAHLGVKQPKIKEKGAMEITGGSASTPVMQTLFRNFLKAQKHQLQDRANAIETGTGRKIIPKPGQTDADRFTEIFGGVGINLNKAGSFTIPDQEAYDELLGIIEEIGEDPSGSLALLGKKKGGPVLHPKIKDFFRKHAPDPKAVDKVFEQAESMIQGRLRTTFGLRSSNKKGRTGYNPFEFRTGVFERFEISPMPRKDSKTGKMIFPNLKMLAFDQDAISHNIDVLERNGFIKQFGFKSRGDFERATLKHAKDTGGFFNTEQSKINPQDRGENEIMTAVFGNVTSKFANIRNPKLKDFLQDTETGKLIKNTIISKDMHDFAGFSTDGKTGFGFQYENLRDNYLPMPVNKNDSIVYMPTAYHGTRSALPSEPGSPLGKFRTSKIGTGEGAQAYGYGLYFAESQAVANHYKEKLSGQMDRESRKYDGESLDYTNPRHIARVRLENEKSNLPRGAITDDGARKSVISKIRSTLTGPGQRSRQADDQLREVLKVLETKSEASVDQGALYKVELAPKEKEYLDWDKPLDKQSPEVKKILDQLLRKKENGLGREQGIDYWSKIGHHGQSAYEDLLGRWAGRSDAETSAYLSKHGIPGIKYFDGQSRQEGKGTKNYVIFDDSDIDITNRVFMPKKADGDAFARPLEEILDRIPATDRFKGNKIPGKPVTTPTGDAFLSLDLDKPIGKLGVVQKDIDYAFEKALDDSGSAGRLAIDRLAEDGHIMSPPNEAHYKAVEKRTLRDRFWYEISSEAMSISFPDHMGDEKAMVMDMTASTSPLADPNYNSELMLSIMSEHARGVPSVTPAVVQKSVSDVFSGEFGKEEARKVGSFGQTFKFLSDVLDEPPLPTNDRQVAVSFNIPDEAFGQYPVLYEVVARYFNNLRDTINHKRGDHPDGPFESFQIQAPSWVQTRAESKMARRKNIDEDEIFEGDAYANAFKKAGEKLRKAGIKIDKDPSTGLPLFTKEVLRDPRVTEVLSPLAIKFRDSKFGTMEIVTLLHENGRKFAELSGKSEALNIGPNIKEIDNAIRRGMKRLMLREGSGDKKKPSVLTQLLQAMTGSKDEITRIEIGKGTFEGAMSPNIRIPLENIPKDLHEVYLSILGDAYLQEAQAGSVFTITDGPADTYSVFIKGAKLDNPNLRDFSETLSSIGHEANLSQRPNGLVVDVNPKFLEDFSTQAIDLDMLEQAVTDSFGEYDIKIGSRKYDSTYVERSDYNKIITNFKNRKTNEFAKQIREKTGLTAKIAKDILRGNEGPSFTALGKGKRKQVERIRSSYDNFLRDIKSVRQKIKSSAKEFEKDIGNLNPKLEKRIARAEARLKK